jgi:hypothetical protein
MKLLKAIALSVVTCAFSGTAMSDEQITVQSLLAKQFATVGAVTSPVGPGLFLQKGDQLFLCFVSETPNSQAVSTRYCKPVR